MRSSLQKDLRWGLAVGAFFALFFSVLAIGIFLVSAATLDRNGISLSSAIAVYWLGGISGGLLLGVLRPWTRRRWSAMLMGPVVALPASAAACVTVFGSWSTWSSNQWITLLLGAVLYGVLGGWFYWEPLSEPEE